MLRRFLRLSAAVALPLIAACASPPPPPPPVVPFETKMAWIIRLEDQRMLRDPAAPIPPPPPAKSGRRTIVVEPPPPPDLLRLLTDDEARIRRRSALAAGRVGLPEAVPALARLLQTDADPKFDRWQRSLLDYRRRISRRAVARGARRSASADCRTCC